MNLKKKLEVEDVTMSNEKKKRKRITKSGKESKKVENEFIVPNNLEIFALGQSDVKLFFTEEIYNQILQCFHNPEHDEVMATFQKQDSLGLDVIPFK